MVAQLFAGDIISVHFCLYLMTTFVINDETKVNSYGFRVLNNGLNLERFQKNPVLLDDHWNSTASVVGKWNNMRVQEGRLLGDIEFDTEDDAANKLKGKVERGYIKGCSMGIAFDPNKMQLSPDGNFLLTESELMEVSLVAVPANANAVKLYAAGTMKLMDEKTIQLSLQKFIDEIQNEKKPNMEKYVLSVDALATLGLDNADDAKAVSMAIVEMQSKYQETLKTVAALEAEAAQRVKDNAKALVSQAVSEGRLSATVQEEFIKMATDNYKLASAIIAAIPARQSLAAGVHNSKPVEVKTVEDFSKLPLENQLAFKNEQPEAYAALFQ